MKNRILHKIKSDLEKISKKHNLLNLSLLWNLSKESVFKSSKTPSTEKWFGMEAWAIVGCAPYFVNIWSLHGLKIKTSQLRFNFSNFLFSKESYVWLNWCRPYPEIYNRFSVNLPLKYDEIEELISEEKYYGKAILYMDWFWTIKFYTFLDKYVICVLL